MTGDAVRDVAGVWVNDTLAARIVKQNGVNTFSYVEGYAEAGGSAVATTLPLGKEVATTSGALPPFFTGLLPEGRRLSALRRTLKASLDDELALLLAVGGNTVGNVSVLPWGQPPSELPPLVDVSDGHGDFAELLDPAAEHDAHALAGVQEKASASRDAILKVSPREFPKLVENEQTCLAAFRTMPSVRRRVVASRVVRDSQGRTGLVVSRFDGHFPHKRPVEDAAQLLGVCVALGQRGLACEKCVRHGLRPWLRAHSGLRHSEHTPVRRHLACTGGSWLDVRAELQEVQCLCI